MVSVTARNLDSLCEICAAHITAAIIGRLNVMYLGKRDEADRRLDKIKEGMAALRASAHAEARA